MRARYPVVTIDGPAGAGKSTVARRLAWRLRYGYVSSGAIYRAIAWCVTGGAALARALADTRVEFRGSAGESRILVDGEDVTGALYTREVSELASALSQRSGVRAYADALQRAHAARGPLVVDGRDAGSVVFPQAECKFYLDASLAARARRRLADPRTSSATEGFEETRAAIAARDRADETRALAPLRRPPDATYVDSSEMTVDEVVELMAKEVERVCSTAS